MSVASSARRVDEDASQFPAYGPVEACLGYLLFYFLVDRVTPAVVAALGDAVLGLPSSSVRFGLAAALWFVLVVTAVDQARRQLAALGVGTYGDAGLRVWSRVVPSSRRTMGYLLALIAGTAVAAVTFDGAVEALLSLIPVVATADVVAFGLAELTVTVAFFVSYSAAAHSLDRLVIGGIRALTSE